MTEEAKARQKARRKAYYQEHRTEILQKAARRRGNMSEEERRAFNQYQRRCYRNRREEILAKAKERYATDEKFRERALAYAAESADRIREYGAAYRKKNRDLLNEKNRKYIRFCKGKYSKPMRSGHGGSRGDTRWRKRRSSLGSAIRRSPTGRTAAPARP